MSYKGRLMSQPMTVFNFDTYALSVKTEELIQWDESLDTVSQGMVWMMTYHRVMGLSANQVGLLKRFFVMRSKDKIKIIINPKLLSIEDEGYLRDIETCASFKNTYQHLIRPAVIKVSYVDTDFVKHDETLIGTDARVFCHELDHLDGILMTDYMNPGERDEFLRRHRKAL